MLQTLRDDLRLVFLNACYSAAQAEAITQVVDCAIGMSQQVADEAAITFAASFYLGIGFGRSVRTAFDLGTSALLLSGISEDLKPQLQVRGGLDASQIVLPNPARDHPIPVDNIHAGLLEAAYRDLEQRQLAGQPVEEVQARIVELRRQMRQGDQVAEGEILGGRYRLGERIGTGGLGTVWKAYDVMHIQPVAVKILHSQYVRDETRRERFFRGARKMAQLDHPSVVRVIEDHGEDDGHCYFVMELLDGGDLRQAVLGNRVTTEAALKMILDVADALHYAHQRGMVHRDVKPANILLDRAGRAKLTDFDLVHAIDAAGGTRKGSLGTVVYVPPEAWDQAKDARPTADIYSLGMTTYFVLCRKDPSPNVLFDLAGSVAQLDCADGIKALILKSLSREPQQRHQSAGEFAEALRRALETPEAPVPSKEVSTPSEPIVGVLRQSREADLDAPITTSIGLQLRLIPAGEFLMGSPDSDEMARDEERPQRAVRISQPFYLGIYPVTQEQYQEVVGDNPSNFKGERRPVESVSWLDAVVFCNKLSSREGLPEYYDIDRGKTTIKGGTGFRLPTEAEWEYACRAGTTGRWYCGDDPQQLGSVAWFGQQSGTGTHPVGSKEPNPWGLYDTLGNVWEWCWDWYDSKYYSKYYSKQYLIILTDTDPIGPKRGNFRVLRGGSFYSFASGVRGASRLSASAGDHSSGFRVARTYR